MAEMITSSVGKGQISTMIRTGSLIAAIISVVTVAWNC
ncbi:putative membrane protein [Desulfosporosinus sp. OT]|nr:putative membrane protein [Desulfosporosinus sp. OT]